MTKERAQYVLDNSNEFGEFHFAFKHEFRNANYQPVRGGITEAEDAYIQMIRSIMNPNKSYYDAVMAIAERLER